MSCEAYKTCIEACARCVTTCEHCAAACLSEGHADHMAACIRLDRDCADMCSLAVSLMSRDSHFAHELCRLCAEVCDACGTECARHEAEHCRRCAEDCHHCAEECRRMAGAHV